MDNTLKEVKRVFMMFLENENIVRQSLEITDLQVTKENNQIIEITFTLCRPGMLIGKGGSTISKLEHYMSKIFDKQIRLLIVESKLWL